MTSDCYRLASISASAQLRFLLSYTPTQQQHVGVRVFLVLQKYQFASFSCGQRAPVFTRETNQLSGCFPCSSPGT